MYNSSIQPNKQYITSLVASTQKIFDKFHEHEFPSEFLDFELVKLSLIDELGLKESIKCEYRLPIGFLNKIYGYIRKKK